MNSLRKKADPRLFAVMYTLLYPGVLGSLMYAYPDNFVSKGAPFTLVGAALAFALFLAFVFDYLHSITEPAKASYSHGTFIADLGLVALMFIAGQKILGTLIFDAAPEFWFLCAARVSGWFWEHMKAGADNEDPTPEGVDLFFIFVYAIGGLIAVQIGWYDSVAYKWVLAAVLLLDALMYLWYPRLAQCIESAKKK
jgi:hypothetical protein